MPCAIAPPTSGPNATPIPVTALNRPIAAPRLSGGKAAVSSVSPSVSTSAAPAPWAARAATRKPTPGASAGEEKPPPGPERAPRRARGEQAQAGHVEEPAAVPIAECGGGDQQHREAEVVGVDGPLQVLDRGTQIEPDRAQ